MRTGMCMTGTPIAVKSISWRTRGTNHFNHTIILKGSLFLLGDRRIPSENKKSENIRMPLLELNQKRVASLLSIFWLGLFAIPSFAQRAGPGIWADPIMKQPFDTQTFRQIKIPDWVQDTVGCGYTLSAMDSKGRAAAAAHGVTISEMGFVDPFYAYYDSKLLKKRSPHVPLGRLEKDIAEYKKLGVRILAVYPPCLQGEVYENHPDWRRIATNTTDVPQIDMKKYQHGG